MRQSTGAPAMTGDACDACQRVEQELALLLRRLRAELERWPVTDVATLGELLRRLNSAG